MALLQKLSETHMSVVFWCFRKPIAVRDGMVWKGSGNAGDFFAHFHISVSATTGGPISTAIRDIRAVEGDAWTTTRGGRGLCTVLHQ